MKEEMCSDGHPNQERGTNSARKQRTTAAQPNKKKKTYSKHVEANPGVLEILMTFLLEVNS